MKIKKLVSSLTLSTCLLAGATATVPAQAANDPFIGQIMWVGFNFCPRGWAMADGQLLPISQNSALFSLLGTTYGGDGRTTFGLPDLRSRVPVHVGTGPGLSTYSWGQKSGSESRTLTTANLPSHNHSMSDVSGHIVADTAGGTAAAAEGRRLADGQRAAIYADVENPDTATTVNTVTGSVQVSGTTDNTGGSTSFDIRQPSLGMYACIATLGTFPSRN